MKKILVNALSEFNGTELSHILNDILLGVDIEAGAWYNLLINVEWDEVDALDDAGHLCSKRILIKGWNIPLEKTLKKDPSREMVLKIGLRLLCAMKDESVWPMIQRIVRWLNSHR